MKIRCAIVAALAFAASASAGAAAAGEVRVTLTGVAPRAGKILVSLQTEAQFMRGQGAYSQAVDPPAGGGDVSVVFPDVAPGAYALMAMHDEDGDYRMRLSETGAPQEGWAISNAARLAGPPDFATVRVEVGQEPVSLAEAMTYPYVPPAQ